MVRQVLSILSLVLLPGLACAGTTYTVATTGNDSAGCAGVMRTIDAGLRCLSPGDTLVLRGGTYRESVQQIFPAGITITAAPGDTVIWQAASPTAGAYPGFAVVLSQPSEYDITFANIIFDGVQKTQATVLVTGNPSGTLGQPSGAHHIRFLNCEFRHSSTSLYLSHTHHNEFVGGSIHDNGTQYGSGLIAHGLYLASDAADNVIEGMEIYNNAHYGIHIYNGQGGANDRNVVRNNTIRNNGVISRTGCGILYASGRDGVVEHNQVTDNPGGGICVGHADMATQIRVGCNTVTGNATAPDFGGIYIAPSARETTLTNNTVHDNHGREVVDVGQGTQTVLLADAGGCAVAPRPLPRPVTPWPAPKHLRILPVGR